MAAGVVWLFRLMAAVAATQLSAAQPDRVVLKPLSQRSLLTNPCVLSRYGQFLKDLAERHDTYQMALVAVVAHGVCQKSRFATQAL